MHGIVLLGRVARETPDIEYVLNIGEQVLGTVLQALAEKLLTEHLPTDVPIHQPHYGLMVARPMSQGFRNVTDDAWML
jgi:hypothetical protein